MIPTYMSGKDFKQGEYSFIILNRYKDIALVRVSRPGTKHWELLHILTDSQGREYIEPHYGLDTINFNLPAMQRLYDDMVTPA